MEKRSKRSPYYQLSLSTSRRLIASKNVRFPNRHPKNQYKIFAEISDRAKRCSQKNYKSRNFLKILDEVIPMAYFGSQHHRKLFYNVVKLILTQSEFECIFVRELAMGYDLGKVPWLSELVQTTSMKICRRYLCEGQMWLLEKIVKPLILHVYAVVKKSDMYELELVPKPLWSSFRQKVINILLKKGHLVPASSLKTPRGTLQLKPKNGYLDSENFRPIIRLTCRRNVNRFKEKLFTQKIGRIIRQIAQQLSATNTTNLFRCWKDYVNRVGSEQLYGIKIDIQDAFGNIDIDFMCYILRKLQECGKISSEVQVYLTCHIKNQYVICGKYKRGSPKVWKWNRGLCQGDRFSSALCQLYMSYLDSVHLGDLCKPMNFLHRTVDDYLFCSIFADDVLKFLSIMRKLHILNELKTQSNVTGYNNLSLHYYGQIIYLETREMKTLYKFGKRYELRHKFRLWNVKQSIYHRDRSKTMNEFLTRPMRYCRNNYYFKKTELNTIFNSEETVLHNFFEAMIYIAFKFDVAVMSVRNIVTDFALVSNIVRKTVYKYSFKAVHTLEDHKGKYSTGKLFLGSFLKIGFQAFILVFKKRKFYKEKLILDALIESRNKFSAKLFVHCNFNKFNKLPSGFTNISLQRRLPHHKGYWY